MSLRVSILSALAKVVGLTFWIDGFPFGALQKKRPEGVCGSTSRTTLV